MLNCDWSIEAKGGRGFREVRLVFVKSKTGSLMLTNKQTNILWQNKKGSVQTMSERESLERFTA